MMNALEASIISNNRRNHSQFHVAIEPTAGISRFQMFNWRGQFHIIADGFRENSQRNIHLKMIWDLWWNGNAIEKFGPYRKIRASDNNVPLSNASFLMKEVTKIAACSKIKTFVTAPLLIRIGSSKRFSLSADFS
jgi:hypothetical protein